MTCVKPVFAVAANVTMDKEVTVQVVFGKKDEREDCPKGPVFRLFVSPFTSKLTKDDVGFKDDVFGANVPVGVTSIDDGCFADWAALSFFPVYN